MTEQAPDLWTGDDGSTAYLVTRWPDGSVEVAVREVEYYGTLGRWSPPVSLVAVAAEVSHV